MGSQIDNNSSWNNVCIIGLGGHAQNKLLPALQSSGLQVVGIVTRTPSSVIIGAKIFSNISDAISSLDKTTLFIIASPPNIHYAQVKEVLESGRDVFVEKPAFLSLNEAAELSRLACDNGVVLVEMLMYLENSSVQHIIHELKSASGSLKSLECQFLIPRVPRNTFRTEESFGNSLLSDMVCYPLSLLAKAGYELSDLTLVSDNFLREGNPVFSITGSSKQANIQIMLGQGEKYINNLKLTFKNNDDISCEPFFFGRAGYRTITRSNKNGKHVGRILESNSYERMFLRRRTEWLVDQKNRLDTLKLVSDALERIGRQASLLYYL